MRRVIMSFDQALSGATGWSVFDKDTQELISYGKFVGGTLLGCKDQLVELIEKWKPEVVLLEDVQQQRNVQTFKLLSMLLGVLQIALEERGIPYTVVHVMKWRAANQIYAKNRAEAKRMAQALIQELYGVKPTQDECEAVLIGRFWFLSRIEF